MNGEMRCCLRGILPLALCCAGSIAQTKAPASTFQTLARQADEARDSNQLEKAAGLYQQALKLNSAWEDGWWSLGSITYDLDRYAECSPAFRRLTKLKPDSVPGWTMAGLCEYKLRKYPEALDSLGHAEQLKFQEPPALASAARLHYALVLTKAGGYEKALAVLTELTRADHKTPEIIAAAGIAGLRQSWVPFEVPEDKRELVYKLGDAMASAMEFDFKIAIQKFGELVAQFPKEPNVHFRYGSFLNTQDDERGVEEIKKTLELAPDHLPALVGLAAIYLKREDKTNAMKYAGQAVQAGPADYSTHVVLGRALLANDEPAKAVAELETAAKLAPASPEARFSLASAYSRLGRKDDAARELVEFKRLQGLENK